MKTIFLFLLLLGVSFSGSFAAESAVPPERSSDLTSWMDADYGTGTWLGARTGLEDKGLTISGGYTAEVWGNTTGGLKRGAVYTGLLDFGAELDLETYWLERSECQHDVARLSGWRTLSGTF